MSLPSRIALILIGLLFSAVAAFAVPAVTVAPAVGPPTAKTTVNGTGFAPSVLIEIYFDTTNLCLAVTNGSGAFSCQIRVPKDAQPQQHWVTAVQRYTGTAAQKPFTVRTDWAQFHGRNAAHIGRNPFENTINAANVGDLDTLWTAPIGPTGTFSTPAVFAGKVYIGGRDGKLYVFNSLTGATIAGFPKTLGGPVSSSSPAIGNGRVYIGTVAPDNKLHAFNATTGAAVAGFPVQLGGAVFSSPALALGNVYVGSADGKLYAFNAVTGSPVAGFPKTLGDAVVASPTIAGGRVYVGDNSGQFHGFDALTGTALAGSPMILGGSISSSAAVAGGVVYVGSQDFKLHAFNDTFQSFVPGFPVLTGSFISSSPAVGRGLVFIGSNDAKLYAWRTSTGGAPFWTATLDGAVTGSPVVASDLVFVNTQFRLYALSAANGAFLWSAGMSATGLNSPAVADGIVYLGSLNGRLYAFSVDGELPAAPLGVRPALSSLKPNPSLKPVRTPD